MQPNITITQSQRIYIIEALFILFPLSLFTAFFITLLSIDLVIKNPLTLSSALPLLVLTIFISAWYLSYTFIKGGTVGLKKASLTPMLFCWLGAVLVVISSAATIFSEISYPLIIFIFGAPALIPFTHIVYERHFNKMSNPSFKRDV